jgi:lysozyme family protein
MNFPQTFNPAYDLVKGNEGGYNRETKGYGETYMGIDRRYKPNWSGWPIVDELKRRFGVPKEEKTFPYTPQLDNSVKEYFYTEYWLKSNAALINDTLLRNAYFDFYVHKPAYAVGFANQIVTGKLTLGTAITQNVANAINANTAAFYNAFYNLRILHYQNKYLNDTYRYIKSQVGVLARARRFPALYPNSINNNNQPKKQTFREKFNFWIGK